DLRLVRARVLTPVTDNRPAVVLPRLDDVDLVAAVRALLARPEVAVHRIEREALLVPLPERVDLRTESRAADERVVLRHRAVVIHADDLAEVIARILSAIGTIAIAARDEERPVLRE